METSKEISLATANPSGKDESIFVNDADIADFLQLVVLGFERTYQTPYPSSSQNYQIGQHTIQVQFAQIALEPYFTRSVNHLRTDHCDRPNLTIKVWDNASTQSELPLFLLL